MALRVVLDANVVLAECLGLAMDSKAGLAAETFANLRRGGIRPAVTESIQTEIDAKIRERVGQILDALRQLENNPPPFPLASGQTTPEVLEQLLSKLRKETTKTAGALLLLESRLGASMEDIPVTSAEQWTVLFGQVAVESATLLAEVQRRQDALGLEVLTWTGKRDHGRFRGLVDSSDLEHLAVLAAISEARRTEILLVTMDGRLHGAREDIKKVAPNVIVTTPTHLPRQIARLRGKE